MMSDDDDGYIDFEEARRRRGNGRDPTFKLLTTVPTPVVEFSAATIPPRRWLYGHRLLRGAASMLIAPPGTGKTMMMIQDGLCIVAGRPWLGFETHECGPVWIYNAEESQVELDRRLLAAMDMMHVPWHEIENQLFLQSGQDGPWDLAMTGEFDQVLFNEPLIRSIVENIRDLGIVALFVDPLIEVHRADENSNPQMKDVAGVFQRIAIESGAAVGFAQHTPKNAYNSESAGALESARGATSMGGKVRVAETLYTMSKRDAEVLAVEEGHRLSYVRLDDAKGNYARREGERWFRFASVNLANGDDVGVLVPADFDQAKTEAAWKKQEDRQMIVKRLIPMNESDRGLTFNDACRRLAEQIDGPFRDMQRAADGKKVSGRVRQKVEEAIKNHEPVNGRKIEIYEAPGAPPNHTRMVKWVRVVHGAGDERENDELF